MKPAYLMNSRSYKSECVRFVVSFSWHVIHGSANASLAAPHPFQGRGKTCNNLRRIRFIIRGGRSRLHLAILLSLSGF